MSLVYRAVQADTGREVAVKILAPALTHQEGFTERFLEAAQRFATLEHPYIVPIYEYNQQDKYLYLVLKLMTGGSLGEKLGDADHPLPLSQVARLVQQIAGALQHAHDKGITHRNLKPENILLDEDDNACLMDFGVAQIITETKSGAMSALLGTPAYIAPEQWQASKIDHRADIYSLGVVVYKLLTGNLPFASGSPFYLMYSHLHGEIPKPSTYQKNLPSEVDVVLLKALSKKPEDRYQKAQDFADALVQAIEGRPKPQTDDKRDLEVTGVRSFRPAAKRDERLDKLWIALERSSGHVFVAPDVEELFQPIDERRTARMEDIWDELERPSTAIYDTKRLQKLLEHINRDQAFLGVKTQRVRLPDAIASQVQRETGLLIIAVETGSPAETGGLYLGDLLLGLDEHILQHQDDMITLLTDEYIGKSVQIHFVRTGQMMQTSVQLTKRDTGKSTL
jgi:serine/threonine protein kinase